MVGEAATADEAVAAAKQGRPDVVVMDLRLAGPLDGLAATRRISSGGPPPASCSSPAPPSRAR